MTIRTFSRYERLEENGRGNMGVVYPAWDPVMDRTVAVKVIHLGFSLDDTKRQFFLERFYREAPKCGKLGRVVHRDLKPAKRALSAGMHQACAGKGSWPKYPKLVTRRRAIS